MHILIIEGFRPAHEILKKTGAKITLLIEQYRISGNEEGFYDDYYTVPDDAAVEFWIKKADEINHKHHIDKVVNFHENRQYETALICKHLGIDYYSVEETLVCKDKILMRKVLNDKGIDSLLNGDLKDVYKYFEDGRVDFPIIVKPYNGWASQKIYKVNNIDELNEIFEKCEKDDLYSRYCFEEFVDGVEYSVESFSYKANHKIIAVTKKFKNHDFVETGHCIPSDISDDLYGGICNKIIEFLNGIGHINGPMHTEVIVTANFKVHIIESHLRLGGDNIPELIKIVSKFDILDIWCKQLCCKKIDWNSVPEIKKSIGVFSTIRYFMSEDKDIGHKIKKIDDKVLKKNKDIIEYKFFVKSGDIVKANMDSFSRLGYVIVKGYNFVETNRLAECCVNDNIIKIEEN